MFYLCQPGKCTKHSQGICPYIHDPSKIAVCTRLYAYESFQNVDIKWLIYNSFLRFLQGKCQKTDGSCLFSHKIDKDKVSGFSELRVTKDDIVEHDNRFFLPVL